MAVGEYECKGVWAEILYPLPPHPSPPYALTLYAITPSPITPPPITPSRPYALTLLLPE